MRPLLTLVAATALSGCATFESNPAALSELHDVAFVCNVPAQATDVHVGMTIFGNERQVRDIDAAAVCDRVFALAKQAAESGATGLTLHKGLPDGADGVLSFDIRTATGRNFMLAKDVPLGALGFYHDNNPFLADPVWVYFSASAELRKSGHVENPPYRLRWIERGRAIAYYPGFEGKWPTLSAQQVAQLDAALWKLIDDSVPALIAAAVRGEPVKSTVVDREFAGEPPE